MENEPDKFDTNQFSKNTRPNFVNMQSMVSLTKLEWKVSQNASIIEYKNDIFLFFRKLLKLLKLKKLLFQIRHINDFFKEKITFCIIK